ncbi:MAG: transcriptional repressor [Candidatus Omnitrophica bacterium]|nr:transcriptional repressor [Candidatus Omnitrophota bacterium]
MSLNIEHPKGAEVILFPRHARRPEQFKAWLANILQTFQEHLGRQGLKLTRQREEILRALMAADRHLGMEELYSSLKKQDPTIGRATIFRTVKLLQECGLVAEVGSVNGAAKFELKADRPHHDHMICVECSRITEFQSPMMERFQDEAIRRHGFTALWHRHEIFGRCRDCWKKRNR